LAAKREQFAPADARPLVVLGAPRSGTTLVATAFAAHPRIGLLMEERRGAMFRLAGGKIPAVKLITPNQVELDRRWHGIYHLVTKLGWRNIDYRLPRSRLSLRDMAARAELNALCLIRDPDASLAALRRREKWNERVYRDILRRTYRLYERLAMEPRIAARIVSFDRFVRDPEGQIRLLCAWLGLPFDPVMLEAPRLNPLYPEATFRLDKTAAAPARPDATDTELAELRVRYAALLARAL